ncbi:MAG: hypothetical protein HYW33_03170 [Candidatus Blackburnbacteria bacterium]|nr:hypothetical protein [Candidatus Blackburnbacteria bacterium]
MLKKAVFIPPLVIFIVAAAFAAGSLHAQRAIANKAKQANLPSKSTVVGGIDLVKVQEKVIPANGFTFNIRWGNLGARMVRDGVISKSKLAQAITGDATFPEEYEAYFKEKGPDTIVLNQTTARFWVDVLWGLGLANKNKVLTQGQMVKLGKTENFASTGGWTLGARKPMQIYAKYSYIPLTAEQEKTVEEIAGSIYRPCCGNSTAFPDCNHGMAALGLIELMVSQGFPKEEIYKTVLAFNSYWFPQTYLDLAYYFEKSGKDYAKVPAQEILAQNYSSAAGYKNVKSKIDPVSWPVLSSGGGCGA